MNKEKKPAKIEFVEGVEEGKYCNSAVINISPFEFIFDFATLIPGIEELGQKPINRIHTRIRTSPQHAKAIFDLLQRKIDEYEKSTGVKLEVPEPPKSRTPYT